MDQDEEVTNAGDVQDAALPTPECTDLTAPKDRSELIYSFFAPGKVGHAFHETGWTPQQCVETLVDLALNCHDQKIRMEAIKYLDEKARQSMMLSGQMEELSRSFTKRLPDGTTATMTATSVSRLTTSSKVLNSLSLTTPNEIIDVSVEEPPDHERTRPTTKCTAGLSGDAAQRGPEPESGAGPVPDQAVGTAPSLQRGSESGGPPGDDGRNREGCRATDPASPGGGDRLDPTAGTRQSESDLGPAGTGQSLFDITAPPTNHDLESTPLSPGAASLPEEDAQPIEEHDVRGHHPPTVDTGTGLATSA